MAKFTIYSKDGGTSRYVGCPTYNGNFGKPSYLEFSQIASPEPINWQIGDFVDYDRMGIRFMLYSLPEVTKQARRGESGESFVYRNVQLYAPTKLLELALWRDLAPSDNLIHFSSLSSVSTYEAVDGIARRIEECMNDYVTELGKVEGFNPNPWKIEVYDSSEIMEEVSKVKDFSITTGDSCLSALDSIYTTWRGIGWVYSQRVENGITYDVITLGRPNVRTSETFGEDETNETNPFLYGKGKGLTAIRRAQSSKDEFCNRVYPFGSDRNMQSRYYNGVQVGGKYIKDHLSVHIPNVMLPLSEWGTSKDPEQGMSYVPDPRLSYVEDAESEVKYGLVPKIVYFDNDENGDIYPSISGVTIANVKGAMSPTDKYYPKPLWADTMRVDEVNSATEVVDDGFEGEEGKSYVAKSSISVNSGTSSKDYSLTSEWRLQFASTFSMPGSGDYTLKEITPTNGEFSLENTPSTVQVNGVHLFAFLNDGNQEELKEIECYETRGGKWAFNSIPSFSIKNASGRTVTMGLILELDVTGARMETWAIPFAINGGSYELSSTTARVSTFDIIVPQLGFDISDYTASGNGLGTISFKDGKCGGRDFTISKVTYIQDTDRWRITLERSEDSSLKQWFPNNSYQVARGDHYVITDIAMPSTYIGMAEQRLLQAATEYLEEHSKVHYVYEPSIDPIAMLSNNGLSLREGIYMRVDDDDIIGDWAEYVLISSLTIDEGAELIPTYKVTLLDEKPSSFLQRERYRYKLMDKQVNQIIISGERSSVVKTQSTSATPSPSPIPSISVGWGPETNMAAALSVNGESKVLSKVNHTHTADDVTNLASWLQLRHYITSSSLEPYAKTEDLQGFMPIMGGSFEGRVDFEDEISLDGVSLPIAIKNMGFVTSSDLPSVALSGNYSDLIGRPTLATVATSGSYNDLTDKPSMVTIAGVQDITGWKTFSTGFETTQLNILGTENDIYIVGRNGGVSMEDNDTGAPIRLQGIATPIDNNDAANKGYVDTSLQGKADEGEVVKLVGDQTIEGFKKFNGDVAVGDSILLAIPEDDGTPGNSEAPYMYGVTYDGDGGETPEVYFAGSFGDEPVIIHGVEVPQNDYDAANKAYVDGKQYPAGVNTDWQTTESSEFTLDGSARNTFDAVRTDHNLALVVPSSTLTSGYIHRLRILNTGDFSIRVTLDNEWRNMQYLDIPERCAGEVEYYYDQNEIWAKFTPLSFYPED